MPLLAKQIALCLALLAASALVTAQAQRALPDIPIHTDAARGASAPSTLMALKPSGNWVLLVLNARLTGSEAYLSQLKADGFDGDKLVVLLISEPELAKHWQARGEMPEKLQLASGNLSRILDGLSLPGTPAFYGITPEGKIAWQHLGYGKNPGERLVQMWDWIKRPTQAVRGNSGVRE
jgi:hypothetical protein